MVKPFLALVSLLSLLVLAVGIHYALAPQTQTAQWVTQATGVSSFALSSAYYEPRFLLEKPTNPAYPQMLPPNRLDFVYAQ